MNEAKDVSVNNASRQTVTFKATWSGGEGPEQRVPEMGLARVDMRGAPNGATVTLHIKGYSNVEFKFKNDGNHGECRLDSNGNYTWSSM